MGTLDTQQFLLGVATWASGAASPNAGGGTPAAIGSWWQRSGTPNPTETYLKGAANDTGWTKQNQVNLKVFNVVNFGAKGDGVTDDTAAIRAAQNAAIAAGGGTVYFPPCPGRVSYRVTRQSASDRGSINIKASSSNITFLGDGYASYISMIGSSGFGDWYLMWIHAGAKHIRIANLRMDDAGVTNQDPTDQDHIINVFSGSGEAPTDDISVYGCFFTQKIGDATRFGGDANAGTNNCRALYNCYDMLNARSAVGVQRYTSHCQVHYNWMQGCSDQTIDFEPTAGTTGQVAPFEWSIIGNMILHTAIETLAFSLAGSSHQGAARNSTIYCNIAYNFIDNGQMGIDLGLSSLTIRGNIVTLESTTLSGNESMLFFEGYVENLVVDSNILMSFTTLGSRAALRFAFDTSVAGIRNLITNNLCRAMSTTTGSVISVSDNQGGVVAGNLCYLDSSVANVGVPIVCAAANIDIDLVMCAGNLCVALNQRLQAGISFGASGFNFKNTSANYNFVNNAVRIVQWTQSAAETFTRWRNASHNLGVAILTVLIGVPPTLVGATIEGTAGPGCQIVSILNASGPEGNVTAPIGSLVTDPGGGPDGVLWAKESGAGTTGWVQEGAAELGMGCADTTVATVARFLAPGGMDLAQASAVEIQIPMPRAGTLRNMRLHCTAGAGTGANTYTLKKNGIATALVIALANNTATGSDTVHSVAVVAGDLISISVTKASAPASGQTNVAVTFELA